MSPVPFQIASSLSPKGEDTFVGEAPPGWGVAVGTHGGLVAALMTRAAGMVAGPERPLRSITIHFPRPTQPGPVTVEVTREREGSRLTTLSLRMLQGGETVALGLAAGGASRDSDHFADLPMPDAPQPETIDRIPYIAGRMPPIMEHADLRPTWSGAPGTASGDEAVVGGWMRALRDAPIDAPACAFLADVWWPAVFAVAEEPFGAPTIDLTVHFRADLPLAGGPDPWVLGRFRSHLVQDGHFEEDGVLWAEDGTVLAQSRQLALVRPLPEQGFPTK